jgi:hypothetical protein
VYSDETMPYLCALLLSNRLIDCSVTRRVSATETSTTAGVLLIFLQDMAAPSSFMKLFKIDSSPGTETQLLLMVHHHQTVTEIATFY